MMDQWVAYLDIVNQGMKLEASLKYESKIRTQSPASTQTTMSAPQSSIAEEQLLELLLQLKV